MKLRSNSYFKGKKLQKLVESLINLEASNGVDRYIRINKLKNETNGKKNVMSNIYVPEDQNHWRGELKKEEIDDE